MSVNSKMTTLADEVRELSGTTTTKSIDTMTSDINEANTEISSQMNLINQIATALEGKASGGEINLQNKTVTPTESSQSIKADSGYDALDTVTVNAIPSNYIIPSGTKTITTNGTHDVKNYASATVNVADSGSGDSIETCTLSFSGNFGFAFNAIVDGSITA